MASLIHESSGLAISRRNPGLVWTHNDSGDTARLFAIRIEDGGVVATLSIAGVPADDWEDLCSFQQEGHPWLAVGDIGDNQKKRKSVAIHILSEPIVDQGWDATNEPQTLQAMVALTIEVSYPSEKIDSESLAYDGVSQRFVLASKELFQSRLFAVPLAHLDGDASRHARSAVTARQIGSVLAPLVTSADISPDGQLLVLITYGPGYFLRRAEDDTWRLKAGAEPELVPLPNRRQGEAVCFDRTGTRLLLTSEFLPTPLFNIEVPGEILVRPKSQR